MNSEVQATLWQIMQTSLYDANAARRLKPLRFESRSAEMQADIEDMLEAPDATYLDDDLLDDGILGGVKEEDADSIFEGDLLMEALDNDRFHMHDEMLE